MSRQQMRVEMVYFIVNSRCVTKQDAGETNQFQVKIVA
jgi:hypothetical protein